MMFFTAMAGYLLLFSSRVPKDMQRLKLKAKLAIPKNVQDSPEDAVDEIEDSSPKSFDSVDASLRRAVNAGEHRVVLKCWSSLKQLNCVPSVPLSQIIESMQCVKKDSQFIVRELTAFFKRHPTECDICHINDILETLGKRLDSQLMGAIEDILPSLGLKKDDRTYEIFLAMHANSRSFTEVQRLVS